MHGLGVPRDLQQRLQRVEQRLRLASRVQHDEAARDEVAEGPRGRRVGLGRGDDLEEGLFEVGVECFDEVLSAAKSKMQKAKSKRKQMSKSKTCAMDDMSRRTHRRAIPQHLFGRRQPLQQVYRPFVSAQLGLNISIAIAITIAREIRVSAPVDQNRGRRTEQTSSTSMTDRSRLINKLQQPSCCVSRRGQRKLREVYTALGC